MTTPALDIEFQYAGDFIGLPGEALFQTWADAAFSAGGGESTGPPGLTLRIVDSGESAELNQTWRHKSGPTNVLSFPFDAPEGLPADALEPYVGDLVICAPLVRREAQEQSKDEEAHWAHLVVHGILHLLGYDHLEKTEAAAMEALEVRIVTGLGYPDPYAAEHRHA